MEIVFFQNRGITHRHCEHGTLSCDFVRILKIVIILSFLLSIPIGLHADTIVDVYGSGIKKSEFILKKYKKDVIKIELDMQREYGKEFLPNFINSKNHMNALENVFLNKKLLINKIKKSGDFAFADFKTVTYPDRVNRYTTIEVVEKNKANRLKFISEEVELKDEVAQPDLIGKMIDYLRIGEKLFFVSHLAFNENYCPVYHCISGFENKELKPFLKIFNTGVIKEKSLILQTLYHDNDHLRRAAAAFLVGHFHDPHDIISTLLPYVDDKSFYVRNNAMRVISSTMRKAKIYDINPKPFLDILDSPYETDRNKALYILLEALNHPLSKKFIIQNGEDTLLSLLRLQQPNNHMPAYQILKKISGENFSEYDIAGWKTWWDDALTHV